MTTNKTKTLSNYDSQTYDNLPQIVPLDSQIEETRKRLQSLRFDDPQYDVVSRQLDSLFNLLGEDIENGYYYPF